jgi:hypothetical protein
MNESITPIRQLAPWRIAGVPLCLAKFLAELE